MIRDVEGRFKKGKLEATIRVLCGIKSRYIQGTWKVQEGGKQQGKDQGP